MASSSHSKESENGETEFYLAITIECKLKSLDMEKLNEEERFTVRTALRKLNSFYELLSNGEQAVKLAAFLNSVLDDVRSLIL